MNTPASSGGRIPGRLAAYAGMFRMNLTAGMQYRAAAWAGMVTQFFWGFMLLMIYEAFYRGSTADPGMEFSQLVAYVWLQQSLLSLVVLWIQDNELLESIASGHVAYELCRPLDIYGFWYMRLMGARLARVSLRVLPILIVSFLLPEPFRMMPPAGAAATGLFALSLSLSAVLTVALSMFIYILTFLTLSPSGARLIVGLTADFLAGTLLPIPLMPTWLQRILSFLPFRYSFDLTARLYSGHIAGAEALFGLFAQAFWTVVLIMLGILALRALLRRAVIQGG